MRKRPLAVILLTALALALALAGCGGSSHSSSSTLASSTSSSVPLSTTSSASTRTTTTKRSTTPSSTTTSTVARTTTAAPPVPTGTPPAPSGLRQTTGYATYELCASQCSGSVPASLRRPLHPPSSCTPSSNGAPVTPTGSPNIGVQPYIGSSWSGARVTWNATSAYRGPILIRGRQIGGSGAVGFGEGHVPYDELQLLASGQQASPPPGGRAWMTITRVKGPGCYAYQVDGTTFSTVIVFRATG